MIDKKYIKRQFIYTLICIVVASIFSSILFNFCLEFIFIGTVFNSEASREMVGNFYEFFKLKAIYNESSLNSNWIFNFITYVSPYIFIALYSVVFSKIYMKKIDKSSQKIDTLENQDINLDLNYEDIDETNKIAEAFEKMRVNLKDAFNTQLKSEKEKQDIIQSLSHDLRSPLTLIKGHVELLQSGAYKNEERLKRYLNVIEKSTNRAVTLVDDLNVLSKIDDSDFILDKKEILLNDFIKEKFEDYKTLAKEKHLKFYVNVDSELNDTVVYIDKSQISRVIDNIITNSFRYVDEGGTIEVDISQSEQDKVVFKIKDSGAGFSKEDLPNVFNRFYKGDKSRANSSGNSGLGLYICKKIIDKHSGEIRVFNENGAVVEFSIWKKKVMKTKEIK
ncbi:MAG: sensor histidine kinase, partial [Intestinibacter sp.]|uniref:sensor histidine kinase n=1 Tax=Intestinibacter sp. TaxID=1965304 RepID=UPI003F149490